MQSNVEAFYYTRTDVWTYCSLSMASSGTRGKASSSTMKYGVLPMPQSGVSAGSPCSPLSSALWNSLRPKIAPSDSLPWCPNSTYRNLVHESRHVNGKNYLSNMRTRFSRLFTMPGCGLYTCFLFVYYPPLVYLGGRYKCDQCWVMRLFMQAHFFFCQFWAWKVHTSAHTWHDWLSFR